MSLGKGETMNKFLKVLCLMSLAVLSTEVLADEVAPEVRVWNLTFDPIVDARPATDDARTDWVTEYREVFEHYDQSERRRYSSMPIDDYWSFRMPASQPKYRGYRSDTSATPNRIKRLLNLSGEF